MKKFIWTFACLIACLLLQAQTPTTGTYPMPNGSGTLRLGIAGEGKDTWLDEDNSPIREKDLSIRYTPLKNTQGFVLEVTNRSLPDSIRLVWVLGGFDATHPSAVIAPETCRDNVFNVEGNHITVYHGKVMELRATQALVPSTPEIRLCDGQKQATPSSLFHSGKKTEAPVLCGMVFIAKGEKAYFCLYKRNRTADYTYDMLPQLIR